MFTDAQLLPISALQHLLFCERQCALIHVERLWAENRLTVEGSLLHRKAHDPKKLISGRGIRTARGLQLVSHRLGLFGVADVVEFHEVTRDTAATEDRTRETDRLVPLPIEYKRGQPKRHDADLVQLCAQALCLEEMRRLLRHSFVAPHAGAWIETHAWRCASGGELSPLMQGRGLKLVSGEIHASRVLVAPHAGAWIETIRN